MIAIGTLRPFPFGANCRPVGVLRRIGSETLVRARAASASEMVAEIQLWRC